MKQMTELDSDIDVTSSTRKLMPLFAFSLLALICTSVTAEPISSTENDSIVTAMYGFINTNYADPATYTDDDYVADLIQSVYGKPSGPDFSKESVYVDSLIEAVNGNSHEISPDFSNDEVYDNHLVEIILK